MMDYDLLPDDGLYTLIKIGEKFPSPLGVFSKYVVIKNASVIPKVYGEHNIVCLTFAKHRMSEWFITSPLINFNIKTLKFETFNSYYQLECTYVPTKS